MKSIDLTREQTNRLLTDVTPVHGYLSWLSDRTDKRGVGIEPPTPREITCCVIARTNHAFLPRPWRPRWATRPASIC